MDISYALLILIIFLIMIIIKKMYYAYGLEKYIIVLENINKEKSEKSQILHKLLDINDINDIKPEGVVLAHIDTYDCGWTTDTAWWSNEKKCWFITGNVETKRAHLHYTHWSEIPKYDFKPYENEL